jgi:ABC-2 type transport system ATP-binding protein
MSDGSPTEHEDGQEAAIVARDVGRVFGSEVALDGLSLSVPRGSIYGFVGPSGSGKTTAVRLLTGIDVPSTGEVEVLGTPVQKFDRALRTRIGYLPQQSVQFPNLTVQENLHFVASLYGLPLRGRDVITEVLERTELVEHRRKPVRALSGGMQRRLALSAALVHRPEVLFLDEPTAGIDPVLRRRIWDHFEELRDEGCTLFVTTQYVSEAAYCDRVGVLSHGRLIADETPNDLRRLALGGDVLELATQPPLDPTPLQALRGLDGVEDVQRLRGNGRVRIVVDAAERRLSEVQQWCSDNDITVESLREDHVSFDDVFALLMQRDEDAHREELAAS